MNKLTRYNLAEIARTYSSDKHNVVCTAYDVEKLEAINAELLKGLEAIENGVKIGLPMGEIWHIAKKYRKAARAAIAKAKGEQP